MEIKMKLGMTGTVLSALLFVSVLTEDFLASSGFFYLALLSAVPLISGIVTGSRKVVLLFPMLLAFAYVPASASYPLTVLSILKLSVIWPLFFVLFAVLSFPESRELEKRAVVTWMMSSTVSAFSVTGIFVMSSPILNPFIVVALGILAGLAMLYVSHSDR